MKPLILVLIIVFMGLEHASLGANYDFSSDCSTGQTLYFRIIDNVNHYVALVGPNSDYLDAWDGFEKPTGEIDLPSAVSYNGIDYTVIVINNHALYNCSGLTGQLTIPSSVVSIKPESFYNCSSLTSLRIPASVTRISRYSFGYCSGLISASIPNTITTIEVGTFSQCNNLESIVIPESVSTIEIYAFSGCGNLKEVVSLNNAPPIIDDWSFGYVPKLIVPCGSKYLYEATNWKEHFGGIEEDNTIGNPFNIYKGITGIDGATGSICDLPTSARSCELVRFNVKPAEGCGMASIAIQNAENPNQIIGMEQEGDSSYSFIMPAFHISVRAVFELNNSTEEIPTAPISIYPNPSFGRVVIEAEDIKHIIFYNVLGQSVHEVIFDGDNYEYNYNGKESGVYLIQVTTSVGVFTKRIVLL